jgi:hypothetical protein
MFRIFALFTGYFLCLLLGSMWWWTAVEIYIFLVLTPEEGLAPSPYVVLSRVPLLIFRNSFVNDALSFLHGTNSVPGELCSHYRALNIWSVTGRVDSLLLKVPNHLRYSSLIFFTQSKHVWVGDLETTQKIYIWLGQFVFLAYEPCTWAYDANNLFPVDPSMLTIRKKLLVLVRLQSMEVYRI